MGASLPDLVARHNTLLALRRRDRRRKARHNCAVLQAYQSVSYRIRAPTEVWVFENRSKALAENVGFFWAAGAAVGRTASARVDQRSRITCFLATATGAGCLRQIAQDCSPTRIPTTRPPFLQAAPDPATIYKTPISPNTGSWDFAGRWPLCASPLQQGLRNPALWVAINPGAWRAPSGPPLGSHPDPGRYHSPGPQGV
ncbi:hypothetical protein ROLI_012040 [Roseobacter fucihabitans]|uniref:Uncharacterized protein n=1 Tax=Roseobacter fucihabitans TaxID=1537242 RepID=A0ABZ2BQK6_9RHOB|nr:hypothetical protein [Roseobacter litoralis]